MKKKNPNQSKRILTKGKKGAHIPFRNSPLTKILRSSFGGTSRTLLILNISPTLSDFEISLSTLRFGRCAKKIENVIRTNIVAGYNKEALQKIVDTYEKKIAEYKIKVEEIQKKQAKMMDFLQGFGVFSEEFMGKLIEQVGNAKGNISNLMALLGAGRNLDLEEAFRRGRRGQLGFGLGGVNNKFALADSDRLFLDDLYEKPGIIYHLNENLFQQGELEDDVHNKINSGGRLEIENGAESGQMLGQESAQAGDTFEAEINGKIVQAQKFILYDQNGDEVYREDLFDESGAIKENLVLFDSLGNQITDLNSLMDRNGVWKLKSKQQESNLRKRRNQREKLLAKELHRAVKEKCICGREMPNTKTDKFLVSEVFTRFKEKLDREEVIENQCTEFFTQIRNYLQIRAEKDKELSESVIKREAEVFEGLSKRWVKQISDLKRRMEFYQNPKRIRLISNEELTEFSNRLKKMLRVYQEERIRRNVIRELRGDNPDLVVNNGELDDEMVGLGNVKKELAEAARAQEALLAATQEDFTTFDSWVAEVDMDSVIVKIEKELGEDIDKIYDDNYNIQSFFFNFSKNVEANYNLLDNKIAFLSSMLYRKFVDRETERAKRPQRAVKIWSRRLSVRNLKEAKKRPMFRNIDRLAQSDIMFLYKNIQEKLENFMKMQKDIGKLGNLGTIDDIKNMITMMDDKPEAKLANGAKPNPMKVENSDEVDETQIAERPTLPKQESRQDNRAPGESEEEEYEDEDEYDEDEEYEDEEITSQVRRNRNESQDTNPIDPSIQKLYGIKKNDFINKFMPVMKTRDRGSVVQSESRIQDRRKNNTISYKPTSQEIEYQKQRAMREEEEFEEYTDEEEYEEDYEDDDEIESINGSVESDTSHPFKRRKPSPEEIDERGENYERNYQHRESEYGGSKVIFYFNNYYFEKYTRS